MKPQRFYRSILVFAICVGALHASAQPAPQAAVEPRTVLVELRYADAEDLRPILSVLPLTVVVKPELNVVMLRGAPDVVDTAKKVIEALDAAPSPEPSIELRGYIVAVSKESTDRTGITGDLAGVVEQLEEIFDYRGFEVLDTVYLRIRQGSGGAVRGRLEAPGNSIYTLSFDRGWIPGFDRAREDEGQPHTLRFDGLTLRPAPEAAPALATDVEIREGQTAVIGKARLEAGGDLILVIEARVVS